MIYFVLMVITIVLLILRWRKVERNRKKWDVVYDDELQYWISEMEGDK